jgi:hypothetical protein
MISYNWENQPIIKRIAKSLKGDGYNVWLDLEQMSGSTLEASITYWSYTNPIIFDFCFQVAKAVEQSEVVLMCMSQKYKDSPNCRLEGEYCVSKKISFVPLMMQNGYSPDGWCVVFLCLFFKFFKIKNFFLRGKGAYELHVGLVLHWDQSFGMTSQMTVTGV